MKMINQPSDLLKGQTDLSSLPAIYLRLDEAIRDPRASMSDLGDIIKGDPALTARLLRLVNSALYGFPSQVETITRALVIVGVKELRDLALATSVVNLFKGITDGLVSMESFWYHSIACGAAAKTLATYRRQPNVERFFVAGMLHDLGRLIIISRLPDQGQEILLRGKSTCELLHPIEREVLGFDHAAVGCALMQAWNLPPSLEEAVAHHHAPSAARRFPLETAIVHVADIIAHAMKYGTSGERYVPPLDGKAWESIGLSTGILPPALNQLERQVHDVFQTIVQDA